ncbi:MAG: hypothetical protein JOY99_06305 [Sphingomonadaceae bacterium]|nr:hypothetical protein [Sphingomonadaceae bacterium]
MKLAILSCALALTLVTSSAEAAQSALSRKVQRIEHACNLPAGTITAVADEVHFAPSPNEKYENVDCALAKLKKGHVEKLGFVGNEADPNAVLDEPYQYIVEGSAPQIAALTAAVRSDGSIIVKAAKADDGTSFLVFKTHQGETWGGADHLMQRIWKKEFGDILLGRAPEPLVNAGAAEN